MTTMHGTTIECTDLSVCADLSGVGALLRLHADDTAEGGDTAVVVEAHGDPDAILESLLTAAEQVRRAFPRLAGARLDTSGSAARQFFVDTGRYPLAGTTDDTPATPSAWTYHVVFGAVLTGGESTDRESAADVGPFPSATAAASFALRFMGRTLAELLDDESEPYDVTVEQIGSFNMTPALWRLIGFTVERYDGEETDGSWSLNGGVREPLASAGA